LPFSSARRAPYLQPGDLGQVVEGLRAGKGSNAVGGVSEVDPGHACDGLLAVAAVHLTTKESVMVAERR